MIENPFQSPQEAGEPTGGAPAREVLVVLAIVLLVPPGLFAALVLLAQFLTSAAAE